MGPWGQLDILITKKSYKYTLGCATIILGLRVTSLDKNGPPHATQNGDGDCTKVPYVVLSSRSIVARLGILPIKRRDREIIPFRSQDCQRNAGERGDTLFREMRAQREDTPVLPLTLLVFQLLPHFQEHPRAQQCEPAIPAPWASSWLSWLLVHSY